MRKGRFSEVQIINVLKEHQAGIPVVELCRKHGWRFFRGNRRNRVVFWWCGD
jgi:hypothetical protein